MARTLSEPDHEALRMMLGWWKLNKDQLQLVLRMVGNMPPRIFGGGLHVEMIKVPENGLPARNGVDVTFTDCEIVGINEEDQLYVTDQDTISVGNWGAFVSNDDGERLGFAVLLNNQENSRWWILNEDCQDEAEDEVIVAGGVVGPSPFTIETPPNQTPSVRDENYEYQLQYTTSGTPTFSVYSGELPSGILLDESRGLLYADTGGTSDPTPTSVRIQMTDQATGRAYVTPEITFTPTVDDLVAVSVTNLGPVVSVPYSDAVTATGGVEPLRFYEDETNTFPDGLSIDVDTGAVTGTPTASGPFTTDVTVVDALNNSDTVTMNFVVAV